MSSLYSTGLCVRMAMLFADCLGFMLFALAIWRNILFCEKWTFDPLQHGMFCWLQLMQTVSNQLSSCLGFMLFATH